MLVQERRGRSPVRPTRRAENRAVSVSAAYLRENLDRQVTLDDLAAAVLAFSASRHIPDDTGGDARDADGVVHRGITRVPLPILAADSQELARLKPRAEALPGVGVIDFCDIARRSVTYEDYERALAATGTRELGYLGLCIWGDAKSVRSITGHLPLLR